MSEYQPDRTILEGKVFSNSDGDPRYLELAGLVEDPINSIEEIDSVRKKRSPPSFVPPPPPRSAKTQQRKPKPKQKEVSQQQISENSGSKKRSKGGNIYAKKVDLSRQKPILPDEEYHVGVSKPAKVKTNDTTTLEKNRNLKIILPNPNINDDFERKCQVQDAIKEEAKTEPYTMSNDYEPLGSVREETEIKGNIYVPMTSVNKDIANNIDNFMGSGGKEGDIKCNVHFKLDSDEVVQNIDENEYELMGNPGTETVTMHVMSPAGKGNGKTRPFKSLSKRELVTHLEKCGLQNLAAVCEKEKLDGQFLEKYVTDEDLMHEPFFLTQFQIKKLRAILNGWRPILGFPNDVDRATD